MFVSYAMHALLGAYLGPESAERVLADQVQRGDVAEIDAVVWFSGLRVIASAELAAQAPDALTRVGEVELKGLPGKQAVFGLAD